MTKFKKQLREYNPTKDLLDEQLIAKAIWECLKENDLDGVIEILEAHISARNKSQLAKEHDLLRTTLYHAFKSKNPTLQFCRSSASLFLFYSDLNLIFFIKNLKKKNL